MAIAFIAVSSAPALERDLAGRDTGRPAGTRRRRSTAARHGGVAPSRTRRQDGAALGASDRLSVCRPRASLPIAHRGVSAQTWDRDETVRLAVVLNDGPGRQRHIPMSFVFDGPTSIALSESVALGVGRGVVGRHGRGGRGHGEGVGGALLDLRHQQGRSRRLTTSADDGSGIEVEIDLADSCKRRLIAARAHPPSTSFTPSVDCVKLRRDVGLGELASRARSIAQELAIELFDMFEYATRYGSSPASRTS